MQTEEDIKELFRRYQRGECSASEKARLHAWLNHYAQHEADGLDNLDATYHADRRQNNRSKFMRWSSYAAAAILLITFWYFKENPSEKSKLESTKLAGNELSLPDYNSAILTLGDGREISLNEKSSKLSLEEAGVRISQAPDGSLAYEVIPETATSELTYNTFTTPKGNTYTILLPDGTKVWLNTGSSLRYPVNFIDSERRVWLDGEAYFEVAHKPNQPFYLNARGSTIEVLGTHFNVSAYEDVSQMTTTLIEGSVRVYNSEYSLLLKPNQQATVTVSSGKMARTDVDPWSVLAWKNGYFRFDRATLEEIFVVISKWYDIQDVEYRGEFTHRFTGTFQRSKNITELLRYMEKLAPVRFQIEEGRVVVMK